MHDWLALQGLDASDVEANRKGTITDRQRARVLGFANRQRRLTLMILAASAVISSIVLVAGGGGWLGFAIPLGFSVLLYGLLELVLFGGWSRAASSPHVVSTEGTVQFAYFSRTRRGVLVTLSDVNYNGLDLYGLSSVLTKGTRVRLFSLQPKGIILAIEPL